MIQHALYLLAFGLIFSLQAQNLREIEFTTYGQYPIRNVEYNPIASEAVALGLKPESSVTIETHSLGRMGPYLYTGNGPIDFVDSESKETVARVSIPNNKNRWLLVFVKNPRYKSDPENNLKYLVYPFDDSLENLPKNGLVFLNISGQELDGLLEQRRVKIGHGESGSYRVQESIPVNLWTRNFKGDRLLPALIKTYQFQPNHRYLMIFFKPVLRGSSDLDVRLLNESIE